MTINELSPGQRATIIKINKGEAARNRLLSMGITPGSTVTILARHPFRGPVTIDLGNSRMAIGREIARAIEVKLE
jgi:ferrous iron transport protein A